MKYSFKFFKEGITKYNNGEYLESIELFNKEEEISGNFPHTFLYRGHSKFKLGDKEGAIQDWTIAQENGSEEAGRVLKEYSKMTIIPN